MYVKYTYTIECYMVNEREPNDLCCSESTAKSMDKNYIISRRVRTNNKKLAYTLQTLVVWCVCIRYSYVIRWTHAVWCERILITISFICTGN